LTDYLEQQLDHADALLEQIRKLERSTAGLPQKDKESAEKLENLPENRQKLGNIENKSENTPELSEEVDNLKSEVDKLEKKVDNPEFTSEMSRDEAETVVNQIANSVDKYPAPKREANSEEGQEQDADVGRSREPDTDTDTVKQPSNQERAQNSSPLAVQLEELDRTVSAMAAALPAGWGAEAGERGYPVSLTRPGSPASYPGIAGAAGGDWNSPAGTAGPGAASAAEPGWVEQADRAFRRDSRRYDGGFYLY